MLGKKLGLSLPILETPKPLQLPTPKEIFLPLAFGQKPLVEIGQSVSIGEKVAESCGGNPAIHSSISGTVVKIEEKNCYYNRKVPTIFIENDQQFSQIPNSPTPILVEETKNELLEKLDEAGVTDETGRSLAVVLATQPAVDALVLRCMDQEPFLVTENGILLQENQDVLQGLRLLQRLSRPNQTIVVLAEHQREAIDLAATWVGRGIAIAITSGNYPLAHPQLLADLLDIPVDNSLFCTPSTAQRCAQGIFHGAPITQLTITINSPMGTTLVTAPMGTKILEILNFVGYHNQLISVGGGIHGTILEDLEISLIPGIQGFTAFSKNKKLEITPCIRCGQCVQICPLHLQPYLQNRNKIDDFASCIHCGACHYVCPAGRLQEKQQEVVSVG